MLLGALVGAGVPVGVMAEAVDKVAPGQVGWRSRSRYAAVGSPPPGATSRSRTPRSTAPGATSSGSSRGRAARGRPVPGPRRVRAAGRGRGPGARRIRPRRCTSTRSARSTPSPTSSVCAPASSTSALERVVVSEVSVGGGTVSTEHGRLPVPPPAVVELLRGVPSSGGPVDLELCTPTGAALLTTLADEWGPQPAMSVAPVGVGAGERDPEGHANVLRLLVGVDVVSTRRCRSLLRPREASTVGAVLLETNVDDLDPRIWPVVIGALLEAGASDAWLTPILMKKGRPAHTAQRAGRGRPGGRRTPGGLPPDLHHRPARAGGRQARARPRDDDRSRSTGTRSR